MKFTELSKKKPQEQPTTKYESNDYNIVNYHGWDFITEAPVVIILPYLRDENAVLLRHEPVPTYQYFYKDTEYKDVTHFITCLSGTTKPNEKLENAVRRELCEETGIVLSDMFELKEDKSLFMTKGNASKYHIFYLELGYSDYRLTHPTGDGSEHEKNSKTLKISLNELDQLRTHDLITEYLITNFKLKNIDMFKK